MKVKTYLGKSPGSGRLIVRARWPVINCNNNNIWKRNCVDMIQTHGTHFQAEFHIWNIVRKHISRAGTSNYTLQILWHVITCQCPWYLFLSQHPSYMRHDKPLSKEITTLNHETSKHNADSVLLTLFNFYSRYPNWKYVCDMVVEKVVILKIEPSSTLHIIHKKKITAESVRGFFYLISHWWQHKNDVSN